jgi:hypothetical protein
MPIFYARLAKAAFLLDWGEDGSGLMMKALRTGSGYHIDVGASDLIAKGEIKLKSGVEVKEVSERSVIVNDGSELPAELIVCATGYRPMNAPVAKRVSEDVAERIGPNWGYGSGPGAIAARGWVSCAKCGSRWRIRRYGFMAAISLCRAIIRSMSGCRSRLGRNASPARCIVKCGARYTTVASEAA